MALERIATDTFDFEYVRSKNYTYVDKTGILYPLVDESIGKQFFLSRPRRFGKSLLVSTLQKLFEGRRDLFEGLAIDSLPWDWAIRYPVILLDMSLCSGATVDEVECEVDATLCRESERLGVPLREKGNLRERFASFIDDVSATGPDGKLVLLVDEYDKPLTRWVGTQEVLPFQAFLKSFYSVVKATESEQRFCFMTGVSKFSKVSIFSDLNNLTDITMDMRFSALLGYTHDEVRENFPGRLAALAEALSAEGGSADVCSTAVGTADATDTAADATGAADANVADAADIDADGAFARLVEAYDGYCFDRSMTRVFNPVSLGRCLDSADMRAYWFETGTPGWLMSYAKREPIDVDSFTLGEADLGTFEPASPSMPAVLFQTGYLTIKKVWGQGLGTVYDLGFPNNEVAAGFNRWLANAYMRPGTDVSKTSGWAVSCQRALCCGDADAFMEVKVASGDDAGQAAAQAALAQIHERGYVEPLRSSGDEVCLLGVAFDCLTHNVGAWASERL